MINFIEHMFGVVFQTTLLDQVLVIFRFMKNEFCPTSVLKWQVTEATCIRRECKEYPL